MKTIVAFDTETTGLLVPSANELSAQPYIIELYMGKFSEDGSLIDEFSTYLNVPMNLDPIITKITGITDKDLVDAPKFVDIYEELSKFMVGVDILTAHNLSFDRNMLANDLLRIDKVLAFPWPPNQICTVRSSKHYEGYRLNLTKLHNYLFEKGFKDAHRASSDVAAQSKCFFEMVKRGDIIL